ncbi:MAG: glycine cleavage system aminomethyltransferase GcvT [Cytophagaceae bacterium]|nr:glycine cleavage system aminomethyltransferase GcvT [Cytophagaceae bacterium]MBK9935525.1 glycine cleavage system aminomethyltransferase GcvT [Cytophagaceae bacterium]MBL0301967.1 glycine cleavage system aminomethyltransferase GcvT [Cytophagaceae bacterium]MBL0324794.1 glycine cleavage system aminomethyltransferase GcvT [Cytophagaceae bacterium]
MDAKKITLSDFHESIGGKMVPFAGFYMPVRYSSDNEEHRCVREGVGVFDVSHMGEFHLKGEKALDLIQHVISNDASVLFDGKIQYAYLPNTEGGVVDDLLVYKIQDNEYMLVVNAGNIEKDWNWISSHNSFGVEMTNLSDDTSLFAIQGPKATATLQKLTSIDLASMDYYTFVTGDFAGHQNVTISATGYTGAGGFEIYLPNAIAEEVWKKIFEAGAEFDIKPIGLGARDTLRLEMGYCLYGNDITDTTSPLEAGLGWVTKFTKKFINSDSLLAEKTAGLKRKLVGLEMIDRGIPRSHYEICDAEGNTIGEISSGTQSPTLGKGIAMGFVKTEFSKTGTEIFVKIREKLLKAHVVKMPFVKPGV